jgi:uncharacterized repeat protein (TIGR03803 family)
MFEKTIVRGLFLAAALAARSFFGLLFLAALSLVATDARAQTLTTLASFNGTDGVGPQGSLTLVGSTLYGMTASGGDYGKGTIFSIPVTGGTPMTLASFNNSNGANPTGSLTLSADGSTLYGMTDGGGPAPYTDNPEGTVFSIPISGGTVTTLASFYGVSPGPNGLDPRGSLTLSRDGSTLYGMTLYGGPNGGGTVFSIPAGGGPLTTMAAFSTFPDGGSISSPAPYGSLTLSADGSTLYGMTSRGPPGSGGGAGTIFSIPASGGNLTTLAAFNGADGQDPLSSLTLSGDGKTLFGMAGGGGTGYYGVVFSFPTSGGTPMVLARFNKDGSDGAGPGGSGQAGSLTLSPDGSTLYGMTNEAGPINNSLNYGYGTIFSVPASGGAVTVLVPFDGENGANPWGDLTFSSDGSTLYGMTQSGGDGLGTIFSLSIPQSTPEPSTLALLAACALGLLACGWRRRLAPAHG